MSSAVSAISNDPADILDRRRRLLLDHDADGFAALFTPDAVIDVPFAGEPATPMRVEGREAILDYARRMLASPLRLDDFEVSQLHRTQDPEVVIAETHTRGTVGATGKPFSVTSVQILTFRDGLIAHFRDFADPRVLTDILKDLEPAGGN